ncbi:MAG: hypothetical protein RLZZ337_1595 [Bacteroidota bacterium]|jgi:hypothetical protein
MSGGFEHEAVGRIKYNRGLLKHSKLRYSEVKKQYIGIGNDSVEQEKSPLSNVEIAAGRKRARIYLIKRKRRLAFQITLAFIVSILTMVLLFWAISTLLTSDFFERQ